MMNSQVKPLPRLFSVQAHLYRQQQEATENLKEAEAEYAACVDVRVRRIQDVVRSVLAKELGILRHMVGSEHLPYLPAELRWALRHWEVKASPRDVLLASHTNPGERREEATVDQDLLVLSDREIAKKVRAKVQEKKTCSIESLKYEARLLNQKTRKVAQARVDRLEMQLEAARKQLRRESMR